jgi:hypothetical protein
MQNIGLWDRLSVENRALQSVSENVSRATVSPLHMQTPYKPRVMSREAAGHVTLALLALRICLAFIDKWIG